MRPLLLLVVFFLSGCAGIPRETVLLSEKVSVEIGQSRETHLDLVDQWAKQRRARIEDFLRFAWTPRFIRNFMKQVDFQKVVCNLPGEMDKALEMQEIVEAISKRIEAKRRELRRSVGKEERQVRKAVRDHYAQLVDMNSAVEANIRSAAKRLKGEKYLRDMASKKINEFVPLEKYGGKLEKLLKLGD